MKSLKITADSATEAPRSPVWGFLRVRRKLSLSGKSLTQACWDYFGGAAFIFEYMNRLVVTDEGMNLTAHGDGSHEAPFGAPRWVCDSWEEIQQILEETYEELEADGELPKN